MSSISAASAAARTSTAKHFKLHVTLEGPDNYEQWKKAFQGQLFSLIKNNNIVQKGAKDGWQLIKTIWVFLRDELPQFLSNWRTVPRIMMGLYGLVFYNTMQWFMSLPEPNNAQAGFVSVVVGAGAAWFGLYVNGKKTDIKK